MKRQQIEQWLSAKWSNSKKAGKARCEPEWYWKPAHPLPDYDVWYVLDGKGAITVNQQCHTVEKGHCILLEPGDEVSASHDPKQRLTVIFIHFNLPEQRLKTPFKSAKLFQTQWIEQCLQRIVEIHNKNMFGVEAEFESLLKASWIEIFRQLQHGMIDRTGKDLAIIDQVSDYLRLHLDQKLDMTALSEQFQLSPRYMSALFKKHTGDSLKQTFTRLRMERARFLLSETTMNITQIASALGFGDIYHFSKMFKAHHGISPLHMKQQSQPAKRNLGTHRRY